MKRFTQVGAVGAAVAITAALTLASAPAQAAGEFGSLVTINPSGGSTTTDGLKIEIAGGQMQVFKNQNEQFYEFSPSPDADANCSMYNYFTIAIDANDDKIVGCAPYGDPSPNAVSWASGTITSNLTAGDQDGTVTLTLVSNEVSAGKTLTLEVLYTYVYPNPFVDIQTTLTIPAGIPGFTGAKQYWNVDATLGGSDFGDQIQGNLADGSEITGVVAADGSALEAFNQLPGQTMSSWAGAYTCAWNTDQTDVTNCPNSANSWAFNGVNSPDGISTDTDIDNGWGVQAPDVSAAGTSVNSWRAYFVSCLNTNISAIQCIDEANNPSLPDTGADSATLAGLLGGGAALLALGVAIVVIRRRSLV